MECNGLILSQENKITSMVTSNVDPSKTVTRANAALPNVCFFFGVCAFESDNGADDGDFASAGILEYKLNYSVVVVVVLFFFFQFVVNSLSEK